MLAQASTFAAGVRVASRAPVKRASVRARLRCARRVRRDGGTRRRAASAQRQKRARASLTRRLAQAVRACATVARDAPYAPGTTAPAYLDGSLPGDFGASPAREQAPRRAGRISYRVRAQHQLGSPSGPPTAALPYPCSSARSSRRAPNASQRLPALGMLRASLHAVFGVNHISLLFSARVWRWAA